MSSAQMSLFEDPVIISFQGLLWLDDDLDFEISKIKKGIQNKFGQLDYVSSKPHISCFEFTIFESQISTVYQKLEMELKNFRPPVFQVGQIKHYSSNNLLFLEVTDRKGFDKFNYLINSLNSLKLGNARLGFSRTPHITIGLFAKHTNVFNELVAQYSGIDFQRSFRAKKLGIRIQEKESKRWRKNLPDLEIGINQ